MKPLPWQFDDGGRAAAGFRGFTGDCVVRAIAIAAELDYRSLYDTFHTTMKANPHLVARGKTSPRDGIPNPLIKWMMNHELGWPWHPTMFIGQGTTVHLAQGEIPMTGRLVVRLSRHLQAVVDGVQRDTFEQSREGTRCVYGYWAAP